MYLESEAEHQKPDILTEQEKNQLRQEDMHRLLTEIFTNAELPLPVIKKPFILDLAAGSSPYAEAIWDFFRGQSFSFLNERFGFYLALEIDKFSSLERTLYDKNRRLIRTPDKKLLVCLQPDANQVRPDPLQIINYHSGSLKKGWRNHITSATDPNENVIHLMHLDATKAASNRVIAQLIKKSGSPNVIYLGQPDVNYYGRSWGAESSAIIWVDILNQISMLAGPETYVIVTLNDPSEAPVFEDMVGKVCPDLAVRKKHLDQKKIDSWNEQGLKPRSSGYHYHGFDTKPQNQVIYLLTKRPT